MDYETELDLERHMADPDWQHIRDMRAPYRFIEEGCEAIEYAERYGWQNPFPSLSAAGWREVANFENTYACTLFNDRIQEAFERDVEEAEAFNYTREHAALMEQYR